MSRLHSFVPAVALAAAAFVASAAGGPPHTIYGLELASGSSRAVWLLDVTTGTSEVVATVPALPGDTFYPNGLALDTGHDRLYLWTREGGLEDDRFLVFLDLHDPSSGLRVAGSLPIELVASGGIFENRYYYIATEGAPGPDQGRTKLVRLSLDPLTGRVAGGPEVLLWDVLPGHGDLGFGDVALDPSTGVLYASAFSFQADLGVFFRCEAGVAGQWSCTLECDGTVPGCATQMQLAFAGGTLYAKRATGDSQFYTVDPATGLVLGTVDQGPDVTDLADARPECSTQLVLATGGGGAGGHGDDDHDDDHDDDGDSPREEPLAGDDLRTFREATLRTSRGMAAPAGLTLVPSSVGEVSVHLSASGQFEITVGSTGGWQLAELRFHPACDLAGFPLLADGQPDVAQFDHVITGLSGTRHTFSFVQPPCGQCNAYALQATLTQGGVTETAWTAGIEFVAGRPATLFTCGACSIVPGTGGDGGCGGDDDSDDHDGDDDGDDDDSDDHDGDDDGDDGDSDDHDGDDS